MQRIGRTSIILLGILLMFSCKNDEQTKIYYYTRSCTYGDINEYQAKRFSWLKDTVLMDIFVYREGKARLLGGGIYLRKDNSVYRFESKNDHVGQCYFTLQKDTCVDFNMSDPRLNSILRTRYCYIGAMDMIIDGEIQHVYKFERTMGTSEVVYNVYFSKDFIPLKEEYVSGVDLECDLELIDSRKVPSDFKIQIENWKRKKHN